MDVELPTITVERVLKVTSVVLYIEVVSVGVTVPLVDVPEHVAFWVIVTTLGQNARFHLYTVVVMVVGRTAAVLVLVVEVKEGSRKRGMEGMKLVEFGGTGIVIVTSVEEGSTVTVDTEMGPTAAEELEVTGTMDEELDATKGVGMMDPEVGSTVTEDALEEVPRQVGRHRGINVVMFQCVTVLTEALDGEEVDVVDVDIADSMKWKTRC